MKVTFDLPDSTVHALRSRVESGKRSRLVAQLINRHLHRKADPLEEAARQANKLTQVNADMEDWEALNGCEEED